MRQNELGNAIFGNLIGFAGLALLVGPWYVSTPELLFATPPVMALTTLIGAVAAGTGFAMAFEKPDNSPT